MRIAFVGLGQMGKPMAMNMLKTGAQMTVVSATDEAFGEFHDKGARATKDVGEAVEADVIFFACRTATSFAAFFWVIGESRRSFGVGKPWWTRARSAIQPR